MVTVARLRRKPRPFQTFTGLTPFEFDRMLAAFAPAYQHAQGQHRRRPDRQRQPGAGRSLALALPERLLMGRMHLRLYLGQSLLSFLFGIDQSNVCRGLSRRLLPVLLRVVPAPLRDAPLRAQEEAATPGPTGGKERRRINTSGELLKSYPELGGVLIDAAEQPFPEPAHEHQRELAYSGKQQGHTIKTQITASKGLILHVLGGLPGCLNGRVLLGASGVLRQVPPEVRIRIDNGYNGTGERYPHLSVRQPLKKRRAPRLTVLGRAFHPLLWVLGMPVERHFARLQRSRILADVFGGCQQRHEDIFCIVAGLLNYRQTGRFCLG